MNTDNSCLFYELLKFDASKPSISLVNQIILGVAIMIFSNLVFITILRLFGDHVIKTVDTESKQEYDKLRDRNVTPTALYLSDILNSVIYAPITEELFFRYFLFKIILVRYYKMNINAAIFLQAIIFGGFHLTNSVFTDQKPTTTAIQMLSATVAGVVQGYAYYYSNSIIPGVVSHLLNNVMSSHYAFTKYSNFVQEKEIKNHIVLSQLRLFSR